MYLLVGDQHNGHAEADHDKHTGTYKRIKVAFKLMMMIVASSCTFIQNQITHLKRLHGPDKRVDSNLSFE